jgi:protein TonB
LSRRGSILDAPTSPTRGAGWLGVAGAVVVHGGLVALGVTLGARGVERAAAALVTEMIEVELPPEPPPPEPTAPAPEPEPVRERRAEPEPEPTAAAPPPEAAQAGQLLAAADEVVDFGDTFVTGDSAKYAGGTTESNGSAAHAVRDADARAGGVPGGTGTDPHGDLSRAPQLLGGKAWDCPFPAEADDAGLDQAVVTLRLEVGADGKVTDARATVDPGHGFAREARRCALRKRFAPALDRAGRPTGNVLTLNIQFER